MRYGGCNQKLKSCRAAFQISSLNKLPSLSFHHFSVTVCCDSGGGGLSRAATRSPAQFAPFVFCRHRRSSGALLLPSKGSINVEAGFREWLCHHGAPLLRRSQRGKCILSVPCQRGHDFVGNIFSTVFDSLHCLHLWTDSVSQMTLSLPDVHLCL